MSDKKKLQLGMNPSTASARLNKDILWDLVKKTNQHHCFHCGFEMQRENFSIEHKQPWLNSNDPAGLFFDLDNISFSHISCNRAAAKSTRDKPVCGTISNYKTGCKCENCPKANREYQRNNYSKDKRRKQYLRTGY